MSIDRNAQFHRIRIDGKTASIEGGEPGRLCQGRHQIRLDIGKRLLRVDQQQDRGPMVFEQQRPVGRAGPGLSPSALHDQLEAETHHDGGWRRNVVRS